MPREQRLSFEHYPGAKSSKLLKFSNSSVFLVFFFFRFLVQISLFCVFRVSKHSVFLKIQKLKKLSDRVKARGYGRVRQEIFRSRERPGGQGGAHGLNFRYRCLRDKDFRD